jgi:hypothetical protein
MEYAMSPLFDHDIEGVEGPGDRFSREMGGLINSYYPMKGWEWISIYQLFSCELTGYRGFGSLAQPGFSVRKHFFS